MTKRSIFFYGITRVSDDAGQINPNHIVRDDGYIATADGEYKIDHQRISSMKAMFGKILTATLLSCLNMMMTSIWFLRTDLMKMAGLGP